jgi:3-carboxy-cis,cis-muconate cycloisomerase
MTNAFEGFLATPEVMEAFGSQQFVAAMLRFEAALTRAQAALELVPHEAALSIIGTCKVELFDTEKLVRDSTRATSLATPLLKNLKEMVGIFNPQAVQFVHFGATSQDVLDTAMVLVTSDALRFIRADLRACVKSLVALGQAHSGTPILARTLMQPASVTTLGLKCVGWAEPLLRGLARMELASTHALQLQLGGAAGTLAQMRGHGEHVAHAMAIELGLRAPVAPWHTQRDSWIALGCELGLVVGSLGKIAKDIGLMSQFEVGEASALEEATIGSFLMVPLAAAQRVPQRVAALLAAMPQEHERACGAWQAEQAEWAQLVVSTHGSVRAMVQALTALNVDPARMQAHIDTAAKKAGTIAAEKWFGTESLRHASDMAVRQLARLQEEWGT